VDFYTAHAAEQFELSGDLAAAWSKLEGYAARLALVFYCCRSALDQVDPGFIDERSMSGGIALSQWFAQEAKRVYGVLTSKNLERHREYLVALIRAKGGKITARELMQASRKYRESVDVAEQALNDLVKEGLAVREMRQPEGDTQRPSGDLYRRTPCFWAYLWW
jgi:hypothetical protein